MKKSARITAIPVITANTLAVGTNFGGGRRNATNNAYDINYFITDHLGSTRVIVGANGTVKAQYNYYPFGKQWEDANLMANTNRYTFSGKEKQTVRNLGFLDFGSRMLSNNEVPGWTTQDPLSEKYYSISPYAYCAGNPLRYIDPNGMMYDDYYSSRNGKYLGSDNDKIYNHMRLIDDSKFNEIVKSGQEEYLVTNQLQNESQIIDIDDNKIQSDLQSVADNSTSSGVEHQIYITLDRQTATISSVTGKSGINGRSTIEYFPAPITGINYADKPGGLVLIGQAHGHPATNESGKVTEKTMSKDHDVPTARSVQIPVYGVDAMDNRPAGTPAGIHRVSPNGTITNNVGKTSSGFNIARDAMQLWGRRYNK
jgi:RHS repeat-associated protein